MKKKRWIIGVVIILLAYTVTDLTLAYKRLPTLYSHVNRIIDQAPVVHVNGRALVYGGTIEYSNPKAFVFYEKSDEGVDLLKSSGIPLGQVPPWYYVKKGDTSYYRYKTAWYKN